MSYTPRQLQAWIELIDRREAREQASLINAVAIGFGGVNSKEGNEHMKKALEKLRGMA